MNHASFVINSLLFTDRNILVRHTDLEVSMIGVLDMENESYQRAKLFSWVFYPTLIGLAIIQVSSFLLYNGRYHPMAKILDGANKNEGAHYYYR